MTLRDARSSESAKPRIAPVLLSPVRLAMPAGARGNVRLSFDAERDEVRVNPALEGLLGSLAPSRREVLDDLRGRDHLDLQAVLDALAPLAALLKPAGEQVRSRGPRLMPLPPATVALPQDKSNSTRRQFFSF